MTQLAERTTAESEASSQLGRVSHWIGGRSVEGTSGRSGPIYDPATGRQTKTVDFASTEEMAEAVRVAEAAFTERRAGRTGEDPAEASVRAGDESGEPAREFARHVALYKRKRGADG